MKRYEDIAAIMKDVLSKSEYGGWLYNTSLGHLNDMLECGEMIKPSNILSCSFNFDEIGAGYGYWQNILNRLKEKEELQNARDL